MNKKVPLRRCIATGEQCAKKDLIRVVRNKEGEVFVDPTGKMNGRGAYLKRSLEAIEIASKKGALKRAKTEETGIKTEMRWSRRVLSCFFLITETKNGFRRSHACYS